MNYSNNPFARGYLDFDIWRQVVVTTGGPGTPIFLPLHFSHGQLADDDVIGHACFFNDCFVLVSEGPPIPAALDGEPFHSGTIQAVRYGVHGLMTDGGYDPIGDNYSLDAAVAVAKSLKFETGLYSRSWEISMAHLRAEDMSYLYSCANTITATGLNFEVFSIPSLDILGIKLISTPWSDENLQMVDGSTRMELEALQHEQGVPTGLTTLLHLAALADVRFLIFDPFACPLDGLPLYEQD